MALVKDETTDPPRIIYTDSEIDKLGRVVFDPDAPESRRWTVELKYNVAPGESLTEAEAALFGSS